jgi:O-acetyl-ADP-ribose deacetylase (regulator of RNase III)
MIYTEVNGDLFTCDDQTALIHCVSRCFNMGAGIAVLFRKKFGNIKELLSQNIPIGGVAYLKTDHRYVYYLVTKEKYFQKPTYKSLEASLNELKRLILEHGVTKIALPQIGCGLDKLKWKRVSEIIKSIFNDVAIEITVYNL